jgi:hypothetical protein
MKTLAVIFIATGCIAVGETFPRFGMPGVGPEALSLFTWFVPAAKSPYVLTGVP